MSKAVERYFQFSLLGLVSSGFFALAGTGKLDLPTIVLTSLALLLRAVVLAGWVKFEVPPRAVFALAVCYIAFYPLDFYWLSRDFFIATVHGVCFLAAVKILTGNTDRDLLYTGVVAFIELVGAALLSWQASFFIWMALYLLFAVAAFTSAEIRHAAAKGGTIVSAGRSLPWRLAGVAVSAMLGILLVTAGLFLLVPRTARAAAVLFPGASRLTGFSNVIDLGTFGSISKDDRVVMHVLSYNRPLPVNLKWRGATLSRFDGRRWFEPTPLLPPTVPINNGIA